MRCPAFPRFPLRCSSSAVCIINFIIRATTHKPAQEKKDSRPNHRSRREKKKRNRSKWEFIQKDVDAIRGRSYGRELGVREEMEARELELTPSGRKANQFCSIKLGGAGE